MRVRVSIGHSVKASGFESPLEIPLSREHGKQDKEVRAEPHEQLFVRHKKYEASFQVTFGHLLRRRKDRWPLTRKDLEIKSADRNLELVGL